ncbi:MAG: hypothetical protein Ct9H90mP8_0880 [Pseudomonadota bacterium]|nr:MAG: hypothetical protein Ct9H90mP8_0880 [Pseudomonadota bacterium]
MESLNTAQRERKKGRVRAKMELVNEKTLVIRELPFGVTTESLIQSIQDAVNKKTHSNLPPSTISPPIKLKSS